MRKIVETEDYKILDSGNFEKLESWNGIILRRPEPQAIWQKSKKDIWNNYFAYYKKDSKNKGEWHYKKTVPDNLYFRYRDLKFKVSPANSKHAGLFPEQVANWDFLYELIRKNADREIKVLNLFAYTGAASLVASRAGANEVVHVDASKNMVAWAKENMQLSNLADHKIRFLVDDCNKFIQREIRRGNKYDIIIMDPPSYGHGPKGEVFRFETEIANLVKETSKLLSDKPLMFLVNSYTTGISNLVIENLLLQNLKKGKIESGPLALKSNNFLLPCGFYCRWLNA